MKRYAFLLSFISFFLIMALSCKEVNGMEKINNAQKSLYKENNYKTAYFAGGCFWGVEFLFEKKKGVIEAISGYMGGKLNNPTYEDVKNGHTGYLETVKIIYDPNIISYEVLSKYFFEIHDPTQENGQGPDIGSQYISAIFYNDEEEKKTAERLKHILKNKGYNVVTKLIPATKFWKAEIHHQNYYSKHHKTPYCRIYQKKF
ncbi:peptide-methionine (S)-S-oxide reductase MsrA [bacterium]|nr:peptide-methionine (S)-S-oxide reductase MsrA [bacterium]